MSRPLLTSPIRRAPQDYPFKDLPSSTKRIVVQGVLAAWNRIIADAEQREGDLSTEGEIALTARIEQALNDILAELRHPSGFSGSLFQDVIREGTFSNYNDEKLEKRPDLIIRLIERYPGTSRSMYGVFAECKLVSSAHPVRDYCQKGLLRFIQGEYAWTMPSGMMIGYASDGYTVPQKLTPYLRSKAKNRLSLKTASLPRLRPDLADEPEVYESGHRREWVHSPSNRSPGDITIIHLWLPLPR
jgi:hypothetical protein